MQVVSKKSFTMKSRSFSASVAGWDFIILGRKEISILTMMYSMAASEIVPTLQAGSTQSVNPCVLPK